MPGRRIHRLPMPVRNNVGALTSRDSVEKFSHSGVALHAPRSELKASVDNALLGLAQSTCNALVTTRERHDEAKSTHEKEWQR